MTPDFLTWIRRCRGLTLQDLADLTNLSMQYVWCLETGARRIHPQLERRLMSALDLDDHAMMRMREMFDEMRRLKPLVAR